MTRNVLVEKLLLFFRSLESPPRWQVENSRSLKLIVMTLYSMVTFGAYAATIVVQIRYCDSIATPNIVTNTLGMPL